MVDKAELVALASEAKTVQSKSQKAFESLRAGGSAEELVKAAHTVQTASRAYTKAQHEADTFELVAIYEAIRAAVLKGVGINESLTAVLLKHDVTAITITIPVSTDPVDADKLVVNTLGKRTVVKSSNGNGSRTRYVYGPDRMNSRQVVEAQGEAEVGAARTQQTLDEPSKFGLTHLADRIAGKLGWDKVPA